MTYEEKYAILNSILSDRKQLFNHIKYEDFINALILSDNVTKYLGISDYTMRRLTSIVLPFKTKGRLINYILAESEYKFCRNCDSYLSKTEFRPNSNSVFKLNSYCKQCQSTTTAKTQPARQAKYELSKRQAIPPWADLNKIKEIYDNCPKGYHVDHVYPLNGKNICGLYVENNLQYLSATENCRKGNRFAE